MTHLFTQMPYKEICDKFMGLYMKVYGEIKMHEVFQKTVNSEYVIQNTNYLIRNSLKLDSKIIDLSLNSTRYFMISKGETFALGSLCMLIRWNGLDNISRYENQMSDKELKSLCLTIIEQQEFWISKKFKNNSHLLNSI